MMTIANMLDAIKAHVGEDRMLALVEHHDLLSFLRGVHEAQSEGVSEIGVYLAISDYLANESA